MATIVEHSCMVITKKQNLLILEKVLDSVGVTKIIAPNSQREALDLAMQELPHLFIFESDLPDASTMAILKKIRSEPMFAPAFSIVVRKFTREEIMQCMELKVAGMLQQPLDPAALAQKIKAILVSLKGLSPYHRNPEDFPGGKITAIRVTGRISSTQEEFFTVEAGLIVPAGKQISLRPADPTKAPIKVSGAGMADNDDAQPQRSILFSYESATGKGREWLLGLKSQAPQRSIKRSLLVYESQSDRGQQLKKMLAFYELDAQVVTSFEKLRMMHESSKDKYKVVYLCEPPMHASGISWDKYCAALQPHERPLHIIATTSQSPVKRPNTTWMRMPFGLDLLVDQIEAAFAQLTLSTNTTSSSGGTTPGGDVAVSMNFFADLVAIDELGAIIDSPYELPLNARIHLTHPSLALIDLSKNLRIAALRRMDAAGTKFRARITNQEGQVSVGRYWKPLCDKLETVRLDPPEGADSNASKNTPASGDAA